MTQDKNVGVADIRTLRRTDDRPAGRAALARELSAVHAS